ncbi:MAG: filamentous hemagglutinin N-terminal domain-containing protein [Cyanobacteria bacterium P01_G01_bin.67]
MKFHRQPKQIKLGLNNTSSTIALITFSILVTGNCDRLKAQIIPDNSLGNEASTVTPNVEINGSPGDRIDGGALRDSNLFHSFEQFNIPDSQRVYFANPEGITNIFSRVTGSNVSEIFGTLGVNGDANLFLLNPNGIIFGENASLDLGGSFVASTADAIQFGDRGFFSTTDPEQPTLLTVNPSALFFNQIQTAKITNRATASAGVNLADEPLFGLRVPDGRSLLLVGGDIVLDGGGLNALEGQVELAGIANSGTLGLNLDGNNLSLTVSESLNLADVFFTNRAQVEVSGQGSGFVEIQGKHITLDNESQIIANTLGNLDGKGISLQTIQLNVRGGSQISASTTERSQGNSGGIEVNAADFIEVTGFSVSGEGQNSMQRERPSQLESDARGEGEAGNLILNTKHLIVQDGARISASTIDKPGGGNIIVNASESVELSGFLRDRQRPGGLSVQTRGSGKAGNLSINTRRLMVRDGAEVSASTFGEGDGGDVNVNATDSVLLIGTSENGQPTRLVAETGGRLESIRRGVVVVGTGNGGNLTINTGQFTIQDKAQVSVSSLENLTDLDSQQGDAGQLEIRADSILLDNQGAISATTSSGNGGDITLKDQDLLLLRRGSQISTTAGTEESGGDGGDIDIAADLIVAIPQENSDITANAFTGIGGNITIDTQNIFGFQENPSLSNITASSEFGLDGTININTSGIEPGQELAQLPLEIIDVSQLVNQNLCLADGGGEFIITGKGGLSPAPHDTLKTDAGWEDWRMVENSELNQQQLSQKSSAVMPRDSFPTAIQDGNPNKIVEAQSWFLAPNGNIVLSAQPVKSVSRSSGISPFSCQL